MAKILQTDTILDKIVATKIREVAERKTTVGEPIPVGEPFQARSGTGTKFLDSLTNPSRPGRPIIAEIKKASPSAGVIRDPFEPVKIAQAYRDHGARAISILTDESFFQGSLDYLAAVRAAVDLPLLRKDFIIDQVQIEDAATVGADAVLLIARILSDELFQQLYEAAGELGLETLVEVHDEQDLDRTMKLTPAPPIIGVNNRNLADFSVSIQTTKRLLPLMPEGTTVVSESGLTDLAALEELTAAGAHAFLIGTAFMKADDPGSELRKLVYDG